MQQERDDSRAKKKLLYEANRKQQLGIDKVSPKSRKMIRKKDSVIEEKRVLELKPKQIKVTFDESISIEDKGFFITESSQIVNQRKRFNNNVINEIIKN